MDIFKNISESEDRDIVVSLPKNRSWMDYLSCFMELKVDSQTFNIAVRSVPRTSSGKKCFIVFDGFLKGWMEIHKLREIPGNEICIELMPIFTSVPYIVAMADIDDYKYLLDNSSMQ